MILHKKHYYYETMYLSRHLYEKEEIKASYLVSLLKKENLDESYFWRSEFYYSFGEEDTFQHILKVYYDFYHILNYNMHNWICSQEINEKTIITITKNLFHSKFNFDVFKYYLYYESKPLPSVIYRRMPKCIDIYSKNAKKVINAILKKDLENVCSYLVYCSRDKPIVLDEIVKYICPDNNIWCRYSNKFHILLSEIIYSLSEKKEKNNYLVESKIYNFDIIDFTDLSLSRIYKIHNESIGCFSLPRKTLKLTVDDIYRKWDVYCFNTPFWNNKFKKHNAELINNEVIFKSDEDEETFYSNYGYYIDEYPSRSNEKNCFDDIVTITYDEFMNKI